MTTMKEMEAQIAALQKQVRFLMEKVGKLPLQADNFVNTTPIAKFSRGSRIQLQRLKTDGCTSLKEWLEVHDTSKLFPGHCVQFTKQCENSLLVIEYVYGWESLQEHYGQCLKYNHTATMQQWSNQSCPNVWAVLEHTSLRTDTHRGVKK